MTKEIEISKEYDFFLLHIKNQFVLAVAEKNTTERIKRYVKLIFLLKTSPDRTVSDVTRRLVDQYKRHIPEFFLKKIQKTILPSVSKKERLVGLKKRA